MIFQLGSKSGPTLSVTRMDTATQTKCTRQSKFWQKTGSTPHQHHHGQPGKPTHERRRCCQVWEEFLSAKFAATEKEKTKRSWLPLPNTQGTEALSDAQFDSALTSMKNRKSCGPDNIPSELYKASPLYNCLLRDLLKKIWLDEEVPVEFVRATFVMLYKHKGSRNDPSKYRCIGLLNHAYKVLNTCLPLGPVP
mgnify:CR=1 FL=1